MATSHAIDAIAMSLQKIHRIEDDTAVKASIIKQAIGPLSNDETAKILRLAISKSGGQLRLIMHLNEEFGGATDAPCAQLTQPLPSHKQARQSQLISNVCLKSCLPM